MGVNPKQLRRHSAAFKAQVLAACAEPRASVVAVALSFGLNDKSAVAEEARRRIAEIYRLERELSALTSDERLSRRCSHAKPLWADLHAWRQLERSRVPDGSSTAKALNYSLNHWEALTHSRADRGLD